MRRLLLILISTRLLAQTPSLTVDQIVAKSIESIGGASNFASLNAIRLHGRMRLGKGQFTPFTVTARRPNRFRMELSVGSDHVTQAYDGAIGWQSIDGEHKQAPTPLTGDSLAHLIDQAANAIGGPLLDLELRHNQAELLGREAVGDVDCYKLKITLSTADTMTVFVDSTNFRIIQEELPFQVNGKPSTIQQTVGYYRHFGPIWVACLFVTREKGGEDNQRLEIESADINPDVDDSLFKMTPPQR